MLPSPPIKRIKRPPVVLDEDTYTDTLSEIIARDFFPGLVKAKLTQDYMEVLDSQDPEWIAEAGRKLNTSTISSFWVQQKRMAKRRTGTGTSFVPTPTPMSIGTMVSTASILGGGPRKLKPDTSLSLDAFQAKYTSEDNASFNNILDRQNEKKRNAVQMANRILKEWGEVDGDSSGEQRKTLETWKSKPRNGFMFVLEGVEDQQLALLAPSTASAFGEEEKAQIKSPKSISYSNTRLPPPPSAAAAREPPPSPSGSGLPIVPSFTGPSPFKIAATLRREMLLNKMVDKVAREKRASTALGNAAKAVSGATGMPRAQMTLIGSSLRWGRNED
ncbi:nuclear protein Es2-domain-containing protein [Terfezia claveryi]|nr:nuclear protein Es2-domain-containing protein [Terfezia claveryi]